MVRISRADLLQQTKSLLQEYALTPQAQLGQNFCIEPGILHLIRKVINEIKPKTILEIGGGLGTLSNVVTDLEIPLTIVEKDPNLAFLLERRFQKNNVNVQSINVLDFKEFEKFEMIIGNIPYEISSPLLSKLWQNLANDKPQKRPHIVFTVQKEFGLRLIAKPRTQTYSRLSVMAQLLSFPQILKIYPPSAFFPTPEVAHAVVWLKPKSFPSDVLDKTFSQFMIDLFNRKNKIVISSLRPRFKRLKDRKEIEDFLRSNPLFTKRVKDLEPFECVLLFQNFSKALSQVNFSKNDNL